MTGANDEDDSRAEANLQWSGLRRSNRSIACFQVHEFRSGLVDCWSNSFSALRLRPRSFPLPPTGLRAISLASGQ